MKYKTGIVTLSLILSLGIQAGFNQQTVKANDPDQLKAEIEELKKENQDLKVKYFNLKMKYETAIKKLKESQSRPAAISEMQTQITHSTQTTKSGTTGAVSPSQGSGTFRIRIESVHSGTAGAVDYSAEIKVLESKLASLQRSANYSSEKQTYRYPGYYYRTPYGREAKKENRKSLNEEKSREYRYRNEARTIQIKLNKLKKEAAAQKSKLTVIGLDLNSNQQLKLVLSPNLRTSPTPGKVYTIRGYKRVFQGATELLVSSMY